MANLTDSHEDMIEQDNTSPDDMADGETRQQDEEVELPDELIAELRSLISKFGKEEQPNRRSELIRAREARFFWAGHQYPYYNSNEGAWAVPATGGFPLNTSQDQNSSRYYYVQNVYTPLGKTLIASLAGQMPGVRFLPDDPFDIDDIDSAKESENYRRAFYFDQDMPQFIKDVARYYYTDGRTVAWVKQIECGKDENDEPKLKEVVDLYGVLEHKCPISLRSPCDFPYQQICMEQNVNQLKAEFPKKAAKIKDTITGPGEDQFDRQCRLGILQGGNMGASGDTYRHLATRQTTWMRPMAFEGVKDEIKRDALKIKFPDGVRVVYAGDIFLEAVPEDMDTCLKVSLPMPGDGQACPSLGEFVIPVQKRLNNLINLVQEGYEKGSASKFVDSKAIDADAMADQVASPEVYYPVKRPTGEALSNLFYKEEPVTFGAEIMGVIQSLKGPDAQFESGAQPALFGGPMTNSKTASVYAQARDQALGALSVTYGPLKTLLAGVTELAKDLAKERNEDSIPAMVPNSRGAYDNLKVDVGKLRAGECRCHAEIDETVPESPAAARQAFQQLMQFIGPTPMGQELLAQPDNQYLFQQSTGIKGFVVPGADSRNKQLREIEELLKSDPIPPTPEELQKVAMHSTMLQAGNQNPPQPKPDDLMRPTIEVDPVFDDHKVEFQEVMRWCNSDEGQQAKTFNPGGFANVRLHGIAHQRAMVAGPAGAGPLQDHIPDPIQAAQATAAQAAVGAHAQADQAAQQQMQMAQQNAPPEEETGGPLPPEQMPIFASQ